ALERDLPPPDQTPRILDAGGGPGRYAIRLAEQGYRVTLFDLAPALLNVARARIGEAGAAGGGHAEAVVEGSVTHPSAFAVGSFDAVLCLGGVLSHLIDPSQRRRALAELRRVARPGAPLFISGLNYIGAFRAVVQWWPDAQTIQIFHRLRERQTLD